MSEDDIIIIQFVKGDNASAQRRAGLTDAQKTGDACLQCGGTDHVTLQVGYVNGTPVKVHTYHLEDWRMGRTPGQPAAP